MIWFAIGGVLGMAQLGVSLIRRPTTMGHPIQGFVAAAILGALIYGGILWLLTRLL